MTVPAQPLTYYGLDDERYRRIGSVVAILAIALGGCGLLSSIANLTAMIVDPPSFFPAAWLWYFITVLCFLTVENALLSAVGISYLRQTRFTWRFAFACVVMMLLQSLTLFVWQIILRMERLDSFLAAAQQFYESIIYLGRAFFMTVVLLALLHPAVRSWFDPPETVRATEPAEFARDDNL